MKFGIVKCLGSIKKNKTERTQKYFLRNVLEEMLISIEDIKDSDKKIDREIDVFKKQFEHIIKEHKTIFEKLPFELEEYESKVDLIFKIKVSLMQMQQGLFKRHSLFDLICLYFFVFSMLLLFVSQLVQLIMS